MCIVMVCLLQTVTATPIYGGGYLGGNYNFGKGYGYGNKGIGHYVYPGYGNYGYPNYYYNGFGNGYFGLSGFRRILSILFFRNFFSKDHFGVHIKAH